MDATFEDGVLTVSMPKTEAAKTKSVTVKPKAKKGWHACRTGRLGVALEACEGALGEERSCVKG